MEKQRYSFDTFISPKILNTIIDLAEVAPLHLDGTERSRLIRNEISRRQVRLRNPNYTMITYALIIDHKKHLMYIFPKTEGKDEISDYLPIKQE